MNYKYVFQKSGQTILISEKIKNSNQDPKLFLKYPESCLVLFFSNDKDSL